MATKRTVLRSSAGKKLYAVRNADGTTGAGLGAPIVTASGGLITFTFADDIINRPDGVVTNADRIVVSVTAVATDVPGNAAGVVLTNTEVPYAYSGRGIGTALATGVFNLIRASGRKAVLRCSFMARFYATHREYGDIVDG